MKKRGMLLPQDTDSGTACKELTQSLRNGSTSKLAIPTIKFTHETERGRARMNNMAETSCDSSLNKNDNGIPEIPAEIASNEGMGLIEAPLASSARVLGSPSISPSRFQKNAKSIESITALSKRALWNCAEPDIEDSGNSVIAQKKKQSRVNESFLHRFRSKKALSVTDLISTEWCQKQMELSLLNREGRKNNEAKNARTIEEDEWCSQKQSGFAVSSAELRRKSREAMKAGTARHVELEREIIKRVEVELKTQEDYWGMNIVNSLNGVNQLLSEGVTRELPVIGVAEGIWITGVIDEIRMPLTANARNPILIDTKTRARETLPGEPQRRNGRLQLMCYKYMWDNLVAGDFPPEQFFEFFDLNPQHTLCEGLRLYGAKSALTLGDVVRYYKITYKMLAPAHDQLQLRYEFQADRSLLGEYKFVFDSVWLNYQIRKCLQFWLGEQEATYAPEEERWKCRKCHFVSYCPLYTHTENTHPLTTSDANIKSRSRKEACSM